MAERPIIHVAQAETDICDFINAFATMSSRKQNIFLSLHHHARPTLNLWRQTFLSIGQNDVEVTTFVHLMAIYEVNNFRAGEGSVLCPEASRINHSCVPNVHHSWNKSLGRLTVHAIKDIAAGEEIQTTYVDVCLGRSQREKLLDEYAFKCDCAACDVSTTFGRASDQRRERLHQIDKELTLLSRATSPLQGVQQLFNMLVDETGLLSEEGLENVRLTQTYVSFFQMGAFL